ncbi:MAG: inorganic phosphate transporter, partial [Bacteroidota bacterium]
MENFYLIIVVILFALAISDLIVGVSNDAVNFLNSAIGSKVAPRYVIMIIASVGIIIGTTFSSGMMEVARKGIFHPDQFYFSEIMIIFLAVMITDILLLDIFNTLALPTSTTVSIVFELLGSAVAVSIVKISRLGESLSEMSNYINSAKALAIISGILLSVVVAFTVGSIIMYITRLFFSFNYKRTFKYFGAIWGGIAITAITYFILIKGAKGTSFLTDATAEWIKTNATLIIFYSFVGWTILLQILYWLVRLDILKLVVLVGTFALAMAFAGNDLVNFIGVPLAGLKSYQAFMADPTTDPNGLLMVALTGKAKANTLLLLIAGMVMVITLWLSKKARRVTETEVNLSRQSSGNERFGSSMLSRTLVKAALDISNTTDKILPKTTKKFLEKRFDPSEYQNSLKNQKDAPSFDMVRASVNLTVASVLIAFATSLKLPLSTTYVTFMVAMGTS